MKRLSLALALIFPFAAAACGDEEDGPCVTDVDCSGDFPVCDFRSGLCVEGCSSAADCSADLPVCNADGTNPSAPAVCICDANSCPAGTACLADGSCGVPDTCGEAGTQGNCAMGQVCLADGTCADACDNGDATTGCLSMEMLCDTSTLSATFNQCAEPQSVTGGCVNAENHDRQAGGPVLTAVELEGDMGIVSPACTGDATVQRFAANVFAPDGLPGSLFTMGIRRLDATGNEGNTFSDGPNEPTHPSSMRVTGTDEYLLEFTLCLSTAQMMQQLAVFVNDADGEASNAACFFAR